MSEKKLTIKRSPRDKEHPYTMVPREFCEDVSISPSLKSLLLYCFSRPNDWQFHPKQLAKQQNICYKKCLRLLKEGIDAGYILKKNVYVNNLLSGAVYFFCDSKSFSKEVCGMEDSETSEEIFENDDILSENEPDSNNVCGMEQIRNSEKVPHLLNTEKQENNERIRNTETVSVQHIRAFSRPSDRLIPHFLKIKSLSPADQQQLANSFSERELLLALEDAKSYHKNKERIKNMAAFLTHRAQEYKVKFRKCL